jgi:hypothetical protein
MKIFPRGFFEIRKIKVHVEKRKRRVRVWTPLFRSLQRFGSPRSNYEAQRFGSDHVHALVFDDHEDPGEIRSDGS